MLITARTGEYLHRVATAIETGRSGYLVLTDTCPECNEKIDMFDTAHIVIAQHPHAFDGPNAQAVWVVIGCEGYWVVDPGSVGLDRGQWQDWASLPDDTTPGDFGA